MAFNTRSVQMGMKIEAVAGTLEVLVAADFAGNVDEDSIKHGFSAPGYKRKRATGTLTKTGVLKSPLKFMQPAFTMEAAGGGATADALWHVPLRVAGMKRDICYKQPYSALDGDPPKVGETIADNADESAATKVHVVGHVADNGDGTGTFWCSPKGATKQAAFGTNATVHNITTPANGLTTDNAVAAAQKGWGFRIYEDDGTTGTESATMEVRRGGELFTACGCKGGVSFHLEHGKPLMIEFTSGRGLPYGELNEDDGEFQFRAGTLMAGVVLPPAAPKLLAGQDITVDGLALNVSKMNFVVNNTISPGETIGKGDGASAPDCGYGIPSISDREVMWDADPKKVPKATLDAFKMMAAGSTFPVYAAVGSLTGPSAGNGLIVLHAPAVQIPDDLTEEDRDGNIAFNMNGQATGTQSDEFRVWHIYP